MIELMIIIVALLGMIFITLASIAYTMDKRPRSRDDVSSLRVQLAAAQGAVNQLQTIMCFNVQTDPAKVLHTVLTMYGVNIEMQHIPEQIMDAAGRGDYEELTILFKIFYGIEIKGVKVQ